MIPLITRKRKPEVLREYVKLLRETAKAQRKIARGVKRKGEDSFTELVRRLKELLRRSPPQPEERWLIILEEDLLKEGA